MFADSSYGPELKLGDEMLRGVTGWATDITNILRNNYEKHTKINFMKIFKVQCLYVWTERQILVHNAYFNIIRGADTVLRN